MAILLLPLPAIAEQGKQDPCDNSADQGLPDAIKRVLSKKFPTQRPLRLDDLSEDDQGLWVQAKGQICPGYVTGHFVSDKFLSYAVILTNINAPMGYKLVSVNEVTKGQYKIDLVFKDEHKDSGALTLYPVVWSLPPGEYQDFYDSKQILRTRHDGMVLERLEAWSVLYYWNRAKFLRWTLSD